MKFICVWKNFDFISTLYTFNIKQDTKIVVNGSILILFENLYIIWNNLVNFSLCIADSP